MSLMKEIFNRFKWWNNTNRLGPDIPTTHFSLYIPSLARKVCEKKFGRFASNAEFRPGAYAIHCSNIFIGKSVVIRPNTMLFATVDGKIIIEDKVLLGSGVHIYVSNHEYRNPKIDIFDQGHMPASNVILKKGCWIGANSIILPGVTIGEHSVIGAGSIVTKNIADFCVAAGNPAKVIKKLN